MKVIDLFGVGAPELFEKPNNNTCFEGSKSFDGIVSFRSTDKNKEMSKEDIIELIK